MRLLPPCRIAHAQSGSALAWTLVLLALAALAQVGLFITLQGRSPAPVKTGTEAESAKNTQETTHTPADVPSLLPDSLPPEELASETPSIELTNTTPLKNAKSYRPQERRIVAGLESSEKTSKPEIQPPDPSILPQDEARVMVSEAIRLRRAGDMAGAVAKLNQALDTLPGHPRVVFEMAATYEAMGMTERASENYRILADMGLARAGSLHAIASRRLAEGLATPDRSGPEEALYIGNIQEIRQPGTDSQTVVLRVDVQARPGIAIQPADVLLPVQFYDLVNGTKVEPTAAEPPTVAWTSHPIDWKEPGIETVEITHKMPPSAADPDSSGERKYLGYLVELYYQEALLDVSARPRRLARYQVPPDPTINPSTSSQFPEIDSDSLPESLDNLGGALLDSGPETR